ncbi:hypothetical protein RJ641_012876 [Dillenia turbinata]|uniref:Uncharacterized protein n=1 Tax=Dillenia turbinata TaxID=194707 RepID=A0AAN8V007_9MAGN
MPPSPALRCSPGRELKPENHKRGHSLESGLILKEKDDDLALFNEMQTRERDNFLLKSTDEFEESFSTKLRYFTDFKLGISIPGRGECSDLLNADAEKTDYDWLLTPPETPLFPSLDDDTPATNLRGRPRSQPISISRSSMMEKSTRSSRGSASPHRLSPSPRSGSSVFQSRGRPTSAAHSSPTHRQQHHSPSPRPSTPPSKASTPAPRSSTPTARRMSTGSTAAATSSGLRGTSPVKTGRGNSASPKIRAWQSNIPGFSADAPPNLRTSLGDRPPSYVRGSSPASSNGKDSSRFRRQSMSPTATRSVSSTHSHDRDRLSYHSKGSITSSGDDDLDSLQSVTVTSLERPASWKVGSYPNSRALTFSKRPTRTITASSAPKRSFDSSIKQMDQRKSPQNMFRPLLSSVPSTTFYVGKTSSAQRPVASRNSSVTTSSNASSDQGTNVAPDTEGSEHNRDDVDSESGKSPNLEAPDEVFVFDEEDLVNEKAGQEILSGLPKVQYGNHDAGPAVERDLGEAEQFHRKDTSLPTCANSEASYVKGHSSEESFEGTILCSRCGCRFRTIEPVEGGTELCYDCLRKDEALAVTTTTSTVEVVEKFCLPVLSTESNKESKIRADSDSLMAVAEVPEVSNMCETGDLQFEEVVIQHQTANNEQLLSCSTSGSLSRTFSEEGEHNLVQQQLSGQTTVACSIADSDAEGQQLQHINESPNVKVDVSETAGIPVLLLRRSSSGRGPVVQGRSFSASTIPYDELSYMRTSTNSMRSSAGYGSASASSSVDWTSSRHADTRVQRQLSGKRSEMENYKCDINTKAHSSTSSISGLSSHAQSLSLAMSSSGDKFDVSVGNMEYESVAEALADAHGNSDSIQLDCNEVPHGRRSVLQEDNSEFSDNFGMTDASALESSRHVMGISLEGNLDAVTNCEVSHRVGEDLKDNLSTISDVETSAMSSESCIEEDALSNTGVSGADSTEAHIRSSLVSIPEIETENGHLSTSGSQSDGDVTQNSKGNRDEGQEPSGTPPSDVDLVVPMEDLYTSDHPCGISEESMVVIERQQGSRARSLTLEEATDSILFCSSIVQSLAYQAATIAIEKENVAPLEGSKPTVVLVGKTGSDRSERQDSRGRNATRRHSKSQKQRQQKTQTDTKPPPCKTEDDKKINEVLEHDSEVPKKVDSLKPPKLESKCNCTIM